MAEVYVWLEDGVERHGEFADGEPLPDGAEKCGRWPDHFEHWVSGEGWVRDQRAWADAMAGAGNVADARNHKYLEALVAISGVELTTGLLVLEARAKGLTVEELASQVLEKSAEFVRREVERQVRQSGGNEYSIPPGDPLAGGQAVR